MKQIIMSSKTLVFLWFCVAMMPMLVSAHERQVFEINGEKYLIVMGSIGEPVVVDDKSGTDLRVYKSDPDDIANSSAAKAEPVVGLEESLKIVMSADGQSREMDLSAAYGQLGAYKTLFFPTKSTQLTYTVVGELNGVKVELPFTCMFGDHVMSHGDDEEQKEEVVSNGVTRIFQAGSFTCPREKAPLGFPVDSATVVETRSKLSGIVDLVRQMVQGLFK